MSLTREKIEEHMAKYFLPVWQAPAPPCTCVECPANDHCESAFDPYNTDGDCLEAK